MSLRTFQLTVIGVGEPVSPSALRMEKRPGRAATELGLTLQLEIDKHPETYGLVYSDTPAVRAGTHWLARGLRAYLAAQGGPR